MHIHATEKQLSQLESLTDPKDIDGLIAEILAQTNFGTLQLVKEATLDAAATVFNALPTFNIEIPSRTVELMINFSLLIAGFIACRRLGVNFVIVCFFVAIYLLYEFLDYECRKVSLILVIFTEAICDFIIEFIFGRKLRSRRRSHSIMAAIKILAKIQTRPDGWNSFLATIVPLVENIYRNKHVNRINAMSLISSMSS